MNNRLSLSLSHHEEAGGRRAEKRGNVEEEEEEEGHLGLHDALHVGGPAVLGGHDAAGRGHQPGDGVQTGRRR